MERDIATIPWAYLHSCNETEELPLYLLIQTFYYCQVGSESDSGELDLGSQLSGTRKYGPEPFCLSSTVFELVDLKEKESSDNDIEFSDREELRTHLESKGFSLEKMMSFPQGLSGEYNSYYHQSEPFEGMIYVEQIMGFPQQMLGRRQCEESGQLSLF
jgi:hypothetical protein